MYANESQLNELWQLVAKMATEPDSSPTIKVGTVITARNRATRARYNDRVTGSTTRPTLRVQAAIYDYLADTADARSLDISKLLLFAALGEIRLTKPYQGRTAGPRNKVLRMTITERQLGHIQRSMRQWEYPSTNPIKFAVAVSLGHLIVDPAASVILTTQEEQILSTVAFAIEIAEIAGSPSLIQKELSRACASARDRFENHGVQPGDPARAKRLSRLLTELVAEIQLQISAADIEELWAQLIREVDALGITGGK